MKVNLVAFGVAREILKDSKLKFEVLKGEKVSDLKHELTQVYPGFLQLKSLKFAVNEEYQLDEYVLQEGDEVVIIPPVSGG